MITLNGRNKACVLYASEIQSKIDGIKSENAQTAGYYQPSANSVGKKLKESIINSRKLLKIKKNEC